MTSKSGLVVGTLHSASATRTWPATTTMKMMQVAATTSGFIFKVDALEILSSGQVMRRCQQLITTYLFYSQLADDADDVDDVDDVDDADDADEVDDVDNADGFDDTDGVDDVADVDDTNNVSLLSQHFPNLRKRLPDLL